MGLQMIVISAAALVLMGIVNSYGSRVAAAYGIAAQLWTYVQMPALAIGAAVSSMAAQNVGAGRWDRIDRITASGIGFNMVLTGVLVAVLYLFDRPVLGLFLSSTAAPSISPSTSTTSPPGPSSCSASPSSCSPRCAPPAP